MAEALRRFLVRMAALAGASEPEDAAQEIILRALKGRVKIKHGNAQTYLKVAARNEAHNQARRRQVIEFHRDTRLDYNGFLASLLLDESERSLYVVDYESIVDARTRLKNLLDINRDAVMEIIEYTEIHPQPVCQRVRVHRLRQELRR